MTQSGHQLANVIAQKRATLAGKSLLQA